MTSCAISRPMEKCHRTQFNSCTSTISPVDGWMHTVTKIIGFSFLTLIMTSCAISQPVEKCHHTQFNSCTSTISGFSLLTIIIGNLHSTYSASDSECFTTHPHSQNHVHTHTHAIPEKIHTLSFNVADSSWEATGGGGQSWQQNRYVSEWGKGEGGGVKHRSLSTILFHSRTDLVQFSYHFCFCHLAGVGGGWRETFFSLSLSLCAESEIIKTTNCWEYKNPQPTKQQPHFSNSKQCNYYAQWVWHKKWVGHTGSITVVQVSPGMMSMKRISQRLQTSCMVSSSSIWLL